MSLRGKIVWTASIARYSPIAPGGPCASVPGDELVSARFLTVILIFINEQKDILADQLGEAQR